MTESRDPSGLGTLGPHPRELPPPCFTCVTCSDSAELAAQKSRHTGLLNGSPSTTNATGANNEQTAAASRCSRLQRASRCLSSPMPKSRARRYDQDHRCRAPRTSHRCTAATAGRRPPARTDEEQPGNEMPHGAFFRANGKTGLYFSMPPTGRPSGSTVAPATDRIQLALFPFSSSGRRRIRHGGFTVLGT